MSTSSGESISIRPDGSEIEVDKRIAPLVDLLGLWGVYVIEVRPEDNILKVRTKSSWTADIISTPPRKIPWFINSLLRVLLWFVARQETNHADV